jgi:hypothetical protein
MVHSIERGLVKKEGEFEQSPKVQRKEMALQWKDQKTLPKES